MVYAPNGKVIRVERISGPAMLSQSVAAQVSTWTVNKNSMDGQAGVSLTGPRSD
jgi:hypothetical protein